MNLLQQLPNGSRIVSQPAILQLLEEMGFAKYEYHNGTYDIVMVQKNIVEFIKPYEVSYRLVNELKHRNTQDDTMNVVIQEVPIWSNQKRLDLLPVLEDCFVRDTKEAVHLFYANGIAKVMATSIQYIPYDEAGGYVWKNWIVNRPIPQDRVCDGPDLFRSFIRHAGGDVDSSDVQALESIFGYLVSRYKDPDEAKAVLLHDPTTSDQTRIRQVFVSALAKVRKVASLTALDLHKPKYADYAACFRNVSTDTSVIVLDDCVGMLRTIASSITDNMRIDRRGKSSNILPFESSPKILLTAFLEPDNLDKTMRTRLLLFEVSGFYSEMFNENIWNYWRLQDWNQFDNYVIECVQTFLQHGLIEQRKVSESRKKLEKLTSKAFAKWCMEYENGEGIQQDKLYVVFDMYAEFCKFTEGIEQISINRFGRWMNIYAQVHDLSIKRKRIGRAQILYLQLVDIGEST